MGYNNKKTVSILLQLVVLGTAALALPTNDTNGGAISGGRAGRKYGDQPQVISIPIGYYKAPSPPTSDESESDNDSTPPKYNVPTSFDDFVPSDKKTYYASRGESYKNPLPPQQPSRTYWKGDSGNDDNGPTWTVPSPADMMVIMDAMKNANAADDQPTGLLSKLTSDPVTTLVAVIVPIGILLMAVVPALTAFFSSGQQNVPTVTTTATGARRLADSPSLVKPILEAIESFSGRSSGQSTCLQKSFCEATKGGNGTDFRSIRTGIYKAFTFVDDYWLETLGVKELMEAMGTGNCDKIRCDASQKKKHEDPKKKQ